MLAFVRDIDKRIEVVKLAEALGQNHGILTTANLQYTEEIISPEKRGKLEEEMRRKLAKYGLQAFCEIHAQHQ